LAWVNHRSKAIPPPADPQPGRRQPNWHAWRDAVQSRRPGPGARQSRGAVPESGTRRWGHFRPLPSPRV